MGNDRRALGLVCCAYVWWGSSAVFWRELSSIHPVDQLAFRICSSLALLVAVAWLLRRRRRAETDADVAAGTDRAASGVSASLFAPGALGAHLTRRHLAYGVGSAVAIGANWALFLLAVGNGQAVEAALGYFLMPIVSIALGIGLLGERLRRLQVAAIALSVVGIAWTVVAVGRLPLIAVFVGVSFALYGLLRKQSPWDPISGLAFEIAVLAPIVVAVLSVRAAAGVAVTGDGRPATIVLLVCTGVVTVVPLLAFSSAARRVPLSVLGLLQYVNPTLQFLVGWQVLGEPVSGTRLIGFGWIWLALALVITDELRSSPAPDGLVPTSGTGC